MNVGRNDEEESVPNENRPSTDDDKSEDNDKAAEGAANKHHTEPNDEHTMQHNMRMYVTPIDVAASKDHDMRRSNYKPRNEGVDNAKKDDEERTQPISPSTPISQDHYSPHSDSVCSYPATSSMKTTQQK